MNGDIVASFIGVLAAIILVAASMSKTQLSSKTRFAYAVLWVIIIVGATLLVSLFVG